jgi:predicted ribosome quality control (RQC) complex YloA/Tae2 family protein
VLSLRELDRVVRALDRRLAGQRLQGASQPDGLRVSLETYGPGEGGERRQHVLLCSDPESARISLSPRPPRALPAPPAFTQYLRAHAVGARMAGVRRLGEDRVAALDLDTREGALRLVLQIMGRRSNVYLLDAEGRVKASLRPADATRPELAVGEPWQDAASRPPQEGRDRFETASDAELFAAIEEHYGAQESESSHAQLRRGVEQALAKEARRLDRKLEKIEQELAAAQAASSLARQGELLKGALGRVKRGDPRVLVRDPESGADVEIALDPAKTPAQNLDAIFKRYQKAVRRLTRGGAQDEAVRAAREELLALEADFAAVADDEEGLRALALREDAADLLRRQAPQPPPARRERDTEVRLAGRTLPRRLAPRRYRTAGDLEIWVGRSDEANDFLTTRLARGKDLFFHLDGAPGSHVILRTEGRDDPPSEAVLDACELAVHFSRAKKASRADVHVVPIKNVRKPRGAKPGLVTVHGGRSVHLRRSPARLERVLTSRVDD